VNKRVYVISSGNADGPIPIDYLGSER
jgi:hypothetical protein